MNTYVPAGYCVCPIHNGRDDTVQSWTIDDYDRLQAIGLRFKLCDSDDAWSYQTVESYSLAGIGKWNILFKI